MIAASPAAEIPAPDSPPMRAWDEEVGRPKNQVIRFQTIAPDQGTQDNIGNNLCLDIIQFNDFADRACDRNPEPECGNKIEKSCECHGIAG